MGLLVVLSRCGLGIADVVRNAVEPGTVHNAVVVRSSQTEPVRFQVPLRTRTAVDGALGRRSSNTRQLWQLPVLADVLNQALLHDIQAWRLYLERNYLSRCFQSIGNLVQSLVNRMNARYAQVFVFSTS